MTEEIGKHHTLVVGAEHLRRLVIGAQAVQSESAAVTDGDDSLELLGITLTALFEAATCHRGCNEGPHIFEAVCGRAYNLAASAYLLAISGYYDESANLIRSIGEIGNVVSLSTSDPELFREWLTSDSATRKKKFSPYKVRMALEKSGGIHIADQDWYERFCEGYTHVTPQTKPGMHNESGQGKIGAIYQESGLKLMLEEMVGIVVPLGIMVCKFFKFDDLFDALKREISEVSSDDSGLAE